MADQLRRFLKDLHELTPKVTEAVARSRDLLERTKSLPGMKTPKERAAEQAKASTPHAP